MKHEIEIPDLPEGWEAVAYRVPVEGEYFLSIDNKISPASNGHWNPWLIISKKQPRRIVLEETCETTHSFWNNSIHIDDAIINIDSKKQWKIVEDNKCAE